MEPLLQVKQPDGQSRNYDFEALAALSEQIPDVGTVIPGRKGGGVALRSLLSGSELETEGGFITLRSGDGLFSASVCLAEILVQGIVVYRLGDASLPTIDGGPLRFFIKDVETCGIAAVNRCANVKHLVSIEISTKLGRDT
ncbi:molybdopterin-dependent oxidoreductase, partial [Dehalococcoidia bacterium]|nr:molybdopterin-dependent oxidoreductase [Dehalococcoidia bacterium]